MQISHNETGMEAAVTIGADVAARDHCLVVVKGTFHCGPDGSLSLASEQQALVNSDEHYGDPARSAVRLESDFALEKPRVDVIVLGKAVAPGGVPVSRLPVRLELPGRVKDVLVVGERRWVSVAGQIFPSDPAPFTEMSLSFDRAFGGVDDSRGPERVSVELRNLAGVGFHPHRRARDIEGLPVPNLELPGQEIRSPRAAYTPVGFGVVARAWEPRRRYAGTYDNRWRDERAPYLPQDFDLAHNLCAPEDQQLDAVQAGEQIRCVHMAHEPVVTYTLPSPHVPVRFRAVDADHKREAKLDTIILEPHLSRVQLVWRCHVPLGRKPTDMREIFIGDIAGAGPIDNRNGKPRFRHLDDALRAIRERKPKGPES